jgi:hypothetical protein
VVLHQARKIGPVLRVERFSRDSHEPEATQDATPRETFLWPVWRFQESYHTYLPAGRCLI